jgi:hypothetical protein
LHFVYDKRIEKYLEIKPLRLLGVGVEGKGIGLMIWHQLEVIPSLEI